MSQPDFDKAAFELVTEFGGPGTYVKTTLGDYDPTTATSPSATVEIPILIALLDLTRPNNGFGTKPGTNEIIQADKEAYVVPPTKRGNPTLLPLDVVNDTIVVNDVSYSIVTMKEVNPSGSDPIVYIFYLRK